VEISYDEKDDILFIRFNREPIVEDVSCGRNANIGMTAHGIGQITILDAEASNLLPIHLSPVLKPVLRFDRPLRAASG
jgi:uncharacterized protein YuzE